MRTRILTCVALLSIPLCLAVAQQDDARQVDWKPEEISAYLQWALDGAPGIPEGDQLSFDRVRVPDSQLELAVKHRKQSLEELERWKQEFDSIIKD